MPTIPQVYCYAFESFRLYPSDYRCECSDGPVNLQPKTFDVLVELVRRHGQLVLKDDLLKAVWHGNCVEEQNLYTQIELIRRKLGDNGATQRIIETVRGRGFRFKLPVSVEAKATNAADTAGDIGSALVRPFSVDWHRFVPVYCGRADLARARPIRGSWGTYAEFGFDDGTLCVFPSGVGVWHLRDRLAFDSLTQAAKWRAIAYAAILGEPAEIASRTTTCLTLVPGHDDPLVHLLHAVRYVFSVVIVRDHQWPTSAIGNALRILAAPRTLYPGAGGHRDGWVAKGIDTSREAQFLLNGIELEDVRQFGAGLIRGVAAWSGIAMVEPDEGLSATILEFERHVQSLWHFSHCVTRFAPGAATPSLAWRATVAQHLRQVLVTLSRIGPRDPIHHRTMVEAVLVTSRLAQVVSDAVAQMTSNLKE